MFLVEIISSHKFISTLAPCVDTDALIVAASWAAAGGWETCRGHVYTVYTVNTAHSVYSRNENELLY